MIIAIVVGFTSQITPVRWFGIRKRSFSHERCSGRRDLEAGFDSFVVKG